MEIAAAWGVGVGVSALLGLSIYVLYAYGGLLSFGHAIFFGFGAYGVAAVLGFGQRCLMTVPIVLAPLLAAAGVALLGLIVGRLLARHQGSVYAMLTFGLGELIYLWAHSQTGWFGGEEGRSLNRLQADSWWPLADSRAMLFLILTYCIGALGLLRLFARSSFALLARASRDNPGRVGALGYSLVRLRTGLSGVSAFLAGLAGALAALNIELASPEHFSPIKSGLAVITTFIGGVTSLTGPVLGAALYQGFATVLASWTSHWMLLFCALSLGLILSRNRGVP